MSDTVTRWLEQLGLGDYVSVFCENDIDAEVLTEMTDADLKELGVTLGHRKKLLKAIAALRSSDSTETLPTGTADSASAPTPVKTSDAERRQLTVMFCDLVGSTQLAQLLDPEELRNVNRAYQDACKAAIEKYEGYVARYMGDGVLAYFGYPRAHEDDAERALHAGLGLIEAIEQLNSSIGRENSVELLTRVGIATGPVVVGDLIGEGASQESAVVGETPNLAARLQTLATPNSVVIGAGTHELAGGRFQYEDLGTHELKGIAEPANAWRVVAESQAESRFEALHPARLTPLVGREHEIALLLDRWEQAKEGDGQVVLLSGEAGIGKSRIAQTLRERTASEESTRLRYQCSPYHRNSALHPVIEQLKRAVRIDAAASPQTKLDRLESLLAQSTRNIEAVAPLFAALLSISSEDRYAPVEMTPERQKEKTLEALIAQMEGLSRERPVLLIFEDVHWADPTSLELLALIIERTQGTRVLVLITFRPWFTPPWSGHTHITSLTLNRLSQRLVTAMVEKVTGGKSLPDEVHYEIVEKTDGMPLFVEELTKTIVESDLLEDRGDHYELTGPLPPLAIPTTLQDSLMARLDQLALAKEVAQIGATIGREFPHELLSALAPLREEALASALEELVKSGLLFCRGIPPEASYAFKHALVQDVAYNSLLKTKRRPLHAHIAEAYETRFPAIVDTQPEVLARHYTEAGLAEKAVHYWHRAGERAMERAANLEAIEHFTRGLNLLEALPDAAERKKHEVRLRLHLGEAQTKRGQLPEAIETFKQAADVARHLGSPEYLARAAVGHEVAEYYASTPEDSSVALLEEALNSLEKADSALRSRVLGRLARALRSAGVSERATILVQEAIEMARRVGDPVALYDALDMKCYGWRSLEHIGERLGDLEEMLRLARETDDLDRVLIVHSWRVYDYLELGDIAAFEAELEAYGRMAEQLHQPVHVWLARSHQTVRALLNGKFTEGERLAEEALALGRSVKDENAAGMFGMQMFTIRREQGRLREVAPLVKHFVERNPSSGSWRPGLALIYSDLGLKREARAEFEHLAATDFLMPRDAKWSASIAYLAEVCAYLRDTTRAAQLYELLLPYTGYNIAVGVAVVCYGAAARYLGLLAAVMGNFETAERHFEKALSLNTVMEAKPWLAHTQHQYAEMLLAKGQASDWPKAKSLLQEAFNIANQLGMKALSEKVSGLLQRDPETGGC